MAYRQVYFRIHTKGYSSGWSSDADRSAFKEESRHLFQELGQTTSNYITNLLPEYFEMKKNGGKETMAI